MTNIEFGKRIGISPWEELIIESGALAAEARRTGDKKMLNDSRQKESQAFLERHRELYKKFFQSELPEEAKQTIATAAAELVKRVHKGEPPLKNFKEE